MAYPVPTSFVPRLVQQDPTTIFDHSVPVFKGQNISRYWDKTDPGNPWLLVDKRPLVKFWILCCELMGWPWVDPKMSTLPGDLAQLRASMQAKSAEKNEIMTKRNWSKDKQPTTDWVEPASPNRGGFPSWQLKPVQESPDKSSPRATTPSGTLSAIQESTSTNESETKEQAAKSSKRAPNAVSPMDTD